MNSIEPGQFKTKVDPRNLKKLEDQGAAKKEETWVLEYWGRVWEERIVPP